MIVKHAMMMAQLWSFLFLHNCKCNESKSQSIQNQTLRQILHLIVDVQIFVNNDIDNLVNKSFNSS